MIKVLNIARDTRKTYERNKNEKPKIQEQSNNSNGHV